MRLAVADTDKLETESFPTTMKPFPLYSKLCPHGLSISTSLILNELLLSPPLLYEEKRENSY